LQTEAPGGEHLEAIYYLTREEYIALKGYLAQMRGLKALAPTAARPIVNCRKLLVCVMEVT
jgi:hypothetical protein